MRNGKLMGALLSATVVVAACGGGDNRVIDLRPPAVANTAPVADAGPSQRVAAAGTRIILDGSKSSDPDGTKLTYSWTIISLPAKSTAVLVGANTVRPSVVLDVEGEYKFGLIVSDGQLQSEESVVKVTAGKGSGDTGTNPGSDNGGDTGLGPVAALSLASSSFIDGGAYPRMYANTGRLDGQNISPALTISGFPADTSYFAIVMDAKCDSAIETGCVMWGVFNLPLTMTSLRENEKLIFTPGVYLGAAPDGSHGYWGPGGGGTGFSDYKIALNVYAMSGPALPYPGSTPVTAKAFEAKYGKQIVGKGTLTAFYRNPT